MAKRIIGTFGLYQALKAEGYELPEECADVTLLLPVDGPIQLNFICNITDVNLMKLGKAFIRLADPEGTL